MQVKIKIIYAPMISARKFYWIEISNSMLIDMDFSTCQMCEIDI